MKQLIFLFFSLVSLASLGQGNVNASSITLAGTTGTALKDTATYLCAGHPCPVGTIIVGSNGTDTTLFIKQSVGWKSYTPGSAGVTAANNGLTTTGTNVQLGGSLVKNTTVGNGTFNLSLLPATLTLGILAPGTTGFTPLQFSTGVNTSPTQNGGLNFDGTHLYLGSQNTQWQVDRQAAGSIGTLQYNFGNSGQFAGTENDNRSITYDQPTSTLIQTNNTGSNATSFVTSENAGQILLDNGISPTLKRTSFQPGSITELVDTNFTLQTGVGGGTLNIKGATGATTGAVSITGGNSTATLVNGGAVSITSGAATVGNAAGGGVTLTAGSGFGTGANGNVLIQAGGTGTGGGLVTASGRVTSLTGTVSIGLQAPNTQINTSSGDISIGAVGGSNNLSIQAGGSTNDITINGTAPFNATFGATFGTSGAYGYGMDNLGDIFLSTDEDGGTGHSTDFTVRPFGNCELVINSATAQPFLYTINSVAGIVPQTLTGSASLNFPSTAAGTSSDLTITVTGAADGDPVVLGTPNGVGAFDATICFTAFVSSANTVKVRMNHYGSGAAVDPPAGTFKVHVQK